MIDMLYLNHVLTRSEYNEIFIKIQTYLKMNFPSNQLRKEQKGKNVYVTNALSKWGFQEIRLCKTDYHQSIELRFRPQLLINPEGYYKLTRIDDFEAIKTSFNYVMQDILALPVPQLNKWKAKRVEAAVDVHVEEHLIPYYLKLFKKGHIAEYFFENEITNKYWNSQTNVYLMAANITVNWYNRYKTIQEKEARSGKAFTDYSETIGILRFETQKRNCEKKVIEILNREQLKRRVLKFYELIVGAGDYYTMDEAIEIIKKSVNHPLKYWNLVKILKLIDRCGSINEAKNCYVQGKDAKKALDTFSKKINQLNELGINPVILPSEWGINHLENLYHKIESEFDSE
jgi:hypothetical protein